jgi:hypothetical protein
MLQQPPTEQLFGRNRWAATLGVHLVELWRELFEHLVHHRANLPQWMVLAHSLIRGDVAEDLTLLLIGSSHAQLDVLHSSSLHNFGHFQQPALESVATHRAYISVGRNSRQPVGKFSWSNVGGVLH